MKTALICSLLVLFGSAILLSKKNSVFAHTTSVAAHATAAADTNIDWEKMSRVERKQYMKDVVLPKMKTIMHDFDPKRFKDVKCVTCHGNGARTGEFKMPNPQLPKLPGTPEGFKKLREKNPRMMEFMSKTMKPTMAGLLGMKPFGPDNPKGFGCGNCHMDKKK